MDWGFFIDYKNVKIAGLMTKKIVCFLIFLCPNIAFGGVLLHLWAYHPSTDKYNDVHVYGLGYEFDNNLIGAYRNTFERTSVYAAKELGLKHISTSLGFVTGYKKLYPLFTINLKYKRGIVSITPIDTDDFARAIMFTLRL